MLLAIRFRVRPWLISAGACGISLLAGAAFYIANLINTRPVGVVIVDAIDARKGPGYAYARAFGESLRDGLEFIVIERREGWERIRLADNRECWVPDSQVENWLPGVASSGGLD